MKEDQRDQVLIAVHDKARGFVRGFRVNDAAYFISPSWLADVGFLVGDDAYRPASQPRVPADQSFAVFRLVLYELAQIDQPGDDVAHIVFA